MTDKKKTQPPMSLEEVQRMIRSGNFKVEMASTDEINLAKKGVDRVLSAIASVVYSEDETFTTDEWVDSVFVSDESTVGDFVRNDKDLIALSKELGFKVEFGSYIKDLAVTI